MLTLLASNDSGQALTEMAQAFDDVKNYYLNGAGKGSTHSTAGWLGAYWDSNHISADRTDVDHAISCPLLFPTTPALW